MPFEKKGSGPGMAFVSVKKIRAPTKGTLNTNAKQAKL